MNNEIVLRNEIPLYTPNLPLFPVTTVIMANGNEKLVNDLKRRHIDVLVTSPNILLDSCIANHTDMLVYHDGDKQFLLSNDQEILYQRLLELKLEPRYVRPLIKSPYPSDSVLNAAVFGKYLICNINTVLQEIIDSAKAKNMQIIDVKQGYTKCSICIVSENAIITEDIGIKRECEKKGIEVLLISKGSVKLSDHEYGFFGGCTGLIDKNRLAVAGNIKKHSDYKIINEFLDKHTIEAVSLNDRELVDIGGILPVMQIS